MSDLVTVKPPTVQLRLQAARRGNQTTALPTFNGVSEEGSEAQLFTIQTLSDWASGLLQHKLIHAGMTFSSQDWQQLWLELNQPSWKEEWQETGGIFPSAEMLKVAHLFLGRLMQSEVATPTYLVPGYSGEVSFQWITESMQITLDLQTPNQLRLVLSENGSSEHYSLEAITE